MGKSDLQDRDSILPETHFQIGSRTIHGDVVTAPMDGLTDSPYRIISRRFGAALTTTEFINAQDVVQNNPNLMDRLKFTLSERPIAFQMFDNNPERLRNAAVSLRSKYDFDFLDVNFGCSNRRVTSRGAGAALLKSPELIAKIIALLSKELDIPITAKIRLGWNEQNKNYLLISRIIEDNGGECLTVHARTKEQGLKGKADWDAISQIKSHIKIPVIGNGDVISTADIDAIKTQTNCDGVMIGRSSIGNPWIFSRKPKDQLKTAEIEDVFFEHLKLSISHYGQEKGIILFRKHASKYLDLLHCSLSDRKKTLTSRSLEEISTIIKSF